LKDGDRGRGLLEGAMNDRDPVKEKPEAVRPSAVPWPPVLLAAAIVAGIILHRYVRLPWPGLNDRPAKAVGYGIGIAGLGLIAWALVTMLREGTNIMPNKTALHLVTRGPFRYWRHPVYMGEVLLLLGLAQATLNVWFVILAPLFALAVYRLAVLPEERHLEARFGADYLAYKARTRRWF
jgi:protein-S-isoprenylcysteine O-methyltransferase Ste14